MCRRKSAGESGRRCPSHTDATLIEERNEVRREQYANKKISTQAAEFLDENGVKYQRGNDMQAAYFQGQEFYDHDKFAEVKDGHTATYPQELLDEGLLPPLFSKPQSGGLWTSPGELDDGKVKTKWTDWAHREGFRNAETKVAEMKIRPHAVIVTIDNNDDVEALTKAFSNGKGTFSFEKMSAAGIDAIHLSEKGNANSKSFNPSERIGGFSMWDMESTVWLRKENIYQGKASEKGTYVEDTNDNEDNRPWDDEEEYSFEPNKGQGYDDESLAVLRRKLMGTATAEDYARAPTTAEVSYIQESIYDGPSSSMKSMTEEEMDAMRTALLDEEEYYPEPLEDEALAELRKKLMGDN